MTAMRTTVFKHSPRDAWLVLVSFSHITLLFAPAFVFDHIPWFGLIALGLVQAFLYAMNFQCTGHNFVHNPFFSAAWMNRVFSVLNSLALGVPQTFYKFHHYNHHAHNNDVPRHYGRTRDCSSIYRYGKPPGTLEPLWSYALIGPLRTDVTPLWREAKKRGQHRMMLVETAALLAFIAAIFLIDWRYGIFYLIVLYAGQALALAENYLEHYGAPNTSRLDDSVSAYSAWYNRFWFNNGYHQEHHYRPGVHWTRIPEIRGQMLEESRRRVVGCHWFNFGRPDATDPDRSKA